MASTLYQVVEQSNFDNEVFQQLTVIPPNPKFDNLLSIEELWFRCGQTGCILPELLLHGGPELQ